MGNLTVSAKSYLTASEGNDLTASGESYSMALLRDSSSGRISRCLGRAESPCLFSWTFFQLPWWGREFLAFLQTSSFRQTNLSDNENRGGRVRFWLYSTYSASGRTNAAQLGGAEACFRPHLPYGEQLGGIEACFRPRNHHLPDITE